MSLVRLLNRLARMERHKVATIDGMRRYSWAQSHERIGRLASGLRSLGTTKGDRIAILSENSHHYFEFLFAAWWIGAIVVPINIRWAQDEILFSMRHSKVRSLFTSDRFRDIGSAIESQAADLEHVRIIGSDKHELWLSSNPVAPNISVEPGDLAAILYTGGTTGLPKGVMLSHRNLLTSALGVIALDGCRATERYLHVAPLFHVGAIGGLLIAVLCGSTNVFLPMFNVKELLAEISTNDVTEVFLVPTMMRMLLDDPDFAKYDVTTIKTIRYGASSIDEVLLDRMMTAFPEASFIQAYGMTELSPVATILAPGDHEASSDRGAKLRSAGRATPVTDVRVVDASGHPMPFGQVGEVVVAGDTVMVGYWGDPEATAASICDGWLRTGDLGMLDEQGYLTIVDRVKDMIITGGENVYSAEVENALADHPAISEVAVIGLPDDIWGERVHAVIVLYENGEISDEELRMHVATKIAGYKIPRSYNFVTAMPLSAAGKIQKNVLRERAFSEP